MKNIKKMKNKKVIKNLLNFFIIIFMILIIISLYNIVEWAKNNKNTEEINNTISNMVIKINEKENDEKEIYQIDFDKLKEINNNTVAWLKVNGTDVEYSVVQGENNNYYLTHSFDNSYNKAGWIFADYRNKFDESDKNIIIYGHNRRDGSMFYTLKNVLNEDWYSIEENHFITFATEEEYSIYQVFSVYQIYNKDFDNSVEFNSDEEFQNYINNIKEKSVYDFNVEITNLDNILTLVTCANDNKYRVVLHAKKLT